MNKFIILSKTSNDDRIFVNPSTITYFQTYESYTRLHFIGENDKAGGVNVTETAEEIVKLIDAIQK